MTDSHKIIDITPHHGAMTKAGKANFVRFCDGASEFIDNSIQAYLSSGSGDSDYVCVRLFINKGGRSRSYMVVEDGGCGMDEKGLEQFATYSLDKETRKQNENFISKFGVGAKQSGFFLGDRVKVITCPVTSSNVFELVLDEKVFEDRYQKGEQVFRADIRQREIGNIVKYASADEKENNSLMNSLKSFENSYSRHFTMIVIRLREKIVRELCSNSRYKEVPYELASVYHFHLHPENKPDEILKHLECLNHNKRIKGAANLYKAADSFLQRHRIPNASITSSSTASNGISRKLDLHFIMYEGSNLNLPKIKLRLSQLKDDDMHLYVKNAKAVFCCNLKFPDPFLLLLDIYHLN